MGSAPGVDLQDLQAVAAAVGRTLVVVLASGSLEYLLLLARRPEALAYRTLLLSEIVGDRHRCHPVETEVPLQHPVVVAAYRSHRHFHHQSSSGVPAAASSFATEEGDSSWMMDQEDHRQNSCRTWRGHSLKPRPWYLEPLRPFGIHLGSRVVDSRPLSCLPRLRRDIAAGDASTDHDTFLLRHPGMYSRWGKELRPGGNRRDLCCPVVGETCHWSLGNHHHQGPVGWSTWAVVRSGTFLRYRAFHLIHLQKVH